MSKLADAARAYIGTWFRHRGRMKTGKSGLDCVGLGVIAYRDLGVEVPDFQHYSHEPYRDGLTERVIEALGAPVAMAPVSLSHLQDGDVVVMRTEHEPHHVAIVGERDYGGIMALTIIHACGFNKRVLEQRLAPDMVDRITSVHRRPV